MPSPHRLRALAVSVLLTAALTAGAAAEPDSTALVFNPAADTLPLYIDPSFSQPPAAWYYNATFVTITEESGAFAAVVIGDPDGGTAAGYMEAEHLIHHAATLSAQPAGPVLSVQNDAGTGLNLRPGPVVDPAQPPIMLCPNGTDVMVLGVWDGWLHVRVMDGGMTGFVQTFGFQTVPEVPRPGTGAPAGSGLFSARQTISDSHGYTLTAAVAEDPPGQYAISVRLAFNGAMLNGILIGYNVYADGEFLGYLETAGRVNNHPDGAPNLFENTFTASPSIASIELRSVWSRSAAKRDAEENPIPEDYIVLYRK